MTKKYRFLDKETLSKTNHLSATVFRYNRTIPNTVIDALPDDKYFPIVFEMLHEHRQGKPVEPHMRVMIVAPDEIGEMQNLLLDVPMPIYMALPEIDLTENPTPESV